ncbi:unnamed protein product (macronuclear) [Paramecium tetraurelia]|uniref:Uncharacterized protein n=1 Tax=Paramecium tetraurelia TaxID=5888 RepID=A0E4Q8_PARTE|nr:uncharacterized protein GSPATT00023450001 [Paramecium tetraurelia]CAK90275.1 unnamed protein product [Paramecium tetraurelia]|eukprot:XP_001457672.1 hypothetical protein (macronuclear) [Paramecium tetraurelia strain d4-2]
MSQQISISRILHSFLNLLPQKKIYLMASLNKSCYDINFVLSNFTNLDALNHLYMVTFLQMLAQKGVEYYEFQQDQQQEYFKYKLQWLMNHTVEIEKKKLLQKIEPDEKNQVQQLITKIQQDKQNHLKLYCNKSISAYIE